MLSSGSRLGHPAVDQDKRDLVIDGLWGIGFGNGHSGPDAEENGYFGNVEFVH